MRTIVLSNFSFRPPKELGKIVLSDSDEIEMQGFPPGIAAQLARGVGRKRVQPSDGAKFLDAVLLEFNGAYVRAVEQEQEQAKENTHA